MKLGLILICAALVASIVLLVEKSSRTWAIVAAALSAFLLTMATGVLQLSISGLPLMLLLCIGLTVAGGIVVAQTSHKLSVVAATVVATCGAVLALLHA